jgi:superfamily II RNA helicase
VQTPIKSLSNQKFYDLKTQFSETTVGIMTGDIKFCPDAQIVVMTTEILRNLLYKKGSTTEHLGLTSSLSIEDLDAVVFDECHYINDKDRGKVWEETMILLPNSVNLVLLSATLDRPEIFANWLGNLKQRKVHLIQTQYRIVPLTHYVISKDYKYVTIMDERELYNEKAYNDWLLECKKTADEQKDYKKKVHNARLEGVDGAIEGKVNIDSYTYRLNKVVELMNNDENLPALFFCLNRKKCELYASKIEHILIDTTDITNVKHIFDFHLRNHKSTLEKTPQYHLLLSLLLKGIAFHHSGLLPILKEIVEILFSRGLIKVMFCTETFAVGLNMPTKTVIFTGLHKYDDVNEKMRILRSDEYTQMAGRAGRRGKDTKGVVIYLPEHDPVFNKELKNMMKGLRPPILSRMDFHYDFILKSLQSSNNVMNIEKNDNSKTTIKWLEIMENSYWYEQRRLEHKKALEDLEKNNKKIQQYNSEDTYWKNIEQKYILEKEYKSEIILSKKKELQKKIESIKSRLIGPKYVEAQKRFDEYIKIKEDNEEINKYICDLEQYKNNINPQINFLYNIGFITNNDPMTLKQNDLTLKGILATEINEGHQILMTEAYINKHMHNLDIISLAQVLSIFLCDKQNEESVTLGDLEANNETKKCIKDIQKIAEEYRIIEEKELYSPKNYWNISLELVDPIKLWLEGGDASYICQTYGLFEGNFIRSIMKMNNILDEYYALATYTQHTEQIEKIIELKSKLIRDIAISDSLYLYLK